MKKEIIRIGELENELFQLINTKAYKEGDFTLASGKKSSYYFNGKLVVLNPRGAVSFSLWILEQIDKLIEKPKAVGGLELGAVPISSTVMAMSFIRSFIVRKKTKDHGTGLVVEGELKKGEPVVVVDDVITTGGSTLKAIRAVEDLGCRVVAVYSLVDRQEGHLPELSAYYNRMKSVFTLKKFLERRKALLPNQNK